MIYVTSDLHGYSLEKFKSLLNKAEFSSNDFLYVLGDVIDRGEDGIKIIKWLMLQRNAVLLAGNHERMLLACDFLFDEITDESIDKLTGTKLNIYSNWILNGGGPTVTALSATRASEIKYILEYLQEAPLFEVLTINDRDFILCHSGLGNFSKEKKLSAYSENDLLWNRPALDEKYFDDIFTVFGHTPTLFYGEAYKGKAIITETWANIDTGAAAGLAPMLLRLDDMKEFYSNEECT